jgi:ribonuclease G
MSKELVVSATRHETRIAILEDDSVVEIFYQRDKEYSLAGSIHKGKVTRVLPGMQSAFVDIGLERDAFLYVSDFFEDNEEYDKVVSSVEEKVLKLEKGVPERIALERGTPAELSAPAADSIDVAAEPATEEEAPVAIETGLAEARPVEARPERDNRGDGRDRDRGGRGRGRRGRRRRGGPGSGLPESKFYSPRRADAEAVVEPVAAAEPAELAGEEDDDFPVLPGESLAKYSAADAHEEIRETPAEHARVVEINTVRASSEPPPLPMEASPVEARPVEASPVEAQPIEARPVEASRVEVRPSEARSVEARPIEASMPEPVRFTAAAFEPPPAEPVAEKRAEPVVEPPPIESSPIGPPPIPEIPAAAEPVVAAAPAEAASEEIESSAAEFVEVVVAVEDEGAPVAEEPGDEVAGVEIIEEDEGPEPARIPTSLTAALREQGNRFPHRLSRRARRKMRGGGGGFQGEPRNAAAASPVAPPPGVQTGDVQTEGTEGSAENPAAPVPVLAVAVPEHRPQRGRDRERSDRPERPPRAERVERGERPERPERAERAERAAAPSISELLREGQEIIVQIAKEPLGQKGARITSHIALPGRFLVYMPTVDHVGVSRKIPSDDERLRLKRILQNNRTGMTGGFIVRTAGDGKSEEELRADMHFLYNLWLDIRQKAEKRPAPLLLHHDLDLVQRILRDQLTSSFKTIWVDNEEAFESVLRFVQRFQPALVNRVKLYTRTNPIFDEFNITAELEKALRPKVWLKSGGYIVINQTEALVAIDVNTGKYVGKSNRLEDTIVRVNTDAIREIVRQIRLRDLGGIIVVDFIDMDERKNRQKVMQSLEEAMRVDRAPYKILAFNDFGLVAITRKRVKQSLERTLCSPCPSCEGAGYIKSVQTVVGEILQEAQKMAKMIEGDDVLLRVNPEVAKVLKSNRNDYLQEIEEIVGRTVMVKSDPTLHQTKFDLA